MRECGDCSICCTVGAVPELMKPAHSSCIFIQTCKAGSCSIFDEPELPKTCKEYDCSWKQGWGDDKIDKPTDNHVLFTSNIIEGQKYLTAIELRPMSIQVTGRNMATQMVASTKVPMIVVAYGRKPPEDTGDYVIIHDETLPRCSRIAGKEIARFSPEVAMYELVKGK